MKILYHYPSKSSLTASRTIANGYRNAFSDLNHIFKFLSIGDDQTKALIEFKPDIFFTSLSPFTLKYLDLSILKKAKALGTKVFVNIPFWNSPLSRGRINEAPSLKNKKEYVGLIMSPHYADAFYNICEQGDPRMEGFETTTGKKYHTVLLAADKTILFPEIDNRFAADISYIGTNLSGKRKFFQDVVRVLDNKYLIKIYGQDWTVFDRYLGYTQKFGQYFNIPVIQDIRRPKLKLHDERKIYASSVISINVHENYQKQFGDLNERTFKIPLAGGFEIMDSVKHIAKYFKPDEEIVVAYNKKDWFEKIDYYISHPKKRDPIIHAGREVVLKKHTYHNRVKQFLSIYKRIK